MECLNFCFFFILLISPDIARAQVPTSYRLRDCNALLSKSSADFEKFLENPSLDGSLPIPKGMEFDIGFPNSTWKAHVRSESINRQPRDLKQLIKKIRQMSFYKDPSKEREAGAMLIEYLDGTQRAVLFTSGNIGIISGEDMSKAINLSGILQNTKAVKTVVHIHTHPDPDNFVSRMGTSGAGILFSELDLGLYEGLKSQLNRFAERDVPFRALLVPNCKFCDDQLFSIRY